MQRGTLAKKLGVNDMGHSLDRESRQKVRATRQEYRTKQRTAIQLIRENKDLSRSERRFSIGASRAFHRVDRHGVPGGTIAYGKYAGKVGAKVKRKADRQSERDAKRASRVASRTHRKESTTRMKTKQGLSTSTKANKLFWSTNAKNRGMTLYDYYDKYVK